MTVGSGGLKGSSSLNLLLLGGEISCPFQDISPTILILLLSPKLARGLSFPKKGQF